MTHTKQAIFGLLKIAKIEDFLSSENICDKDAQKLRAFAESEKLSLPSFVLSHYERIKINGFRGVAVFKDDKCPVCGASIPHDEIQFISSGDNVGLCDNCFSFISPNTPTDYNSFINDILSHP